MISPRPTTFTFQNLGTSGKTGTPMPGCRLTVVNDAVMK